MPPTLYSVRHAEAEHNIKRRFHIPDPILTPRGRTECRNLRKTFPHHNKIDLWRGEDWFQFNGGWMEFEAVEARAAALRTWLYGIEAQHIVLVTHGGFLHYLTEDGTVSDPKKVRTFTFTKDSTAERAHFVEVGKKKHDVETDSTILVELDELISTAPLKNTLRIVPIERYPLPGNPADSKGEESWDEWPEYTAHDVPLSYEDVVKKFVVSEGKMPCVLNAILGIFLVIAMSFPLATDWKSLSL
ncbi:hypothetical protein BCON_0261g00190 [Botryotinia convoluta]|uniref:Uncharacterized protein n=1 Tax=Botryotinia convoluta TaxID=54673 RepID=A0A4Z1HKR5_9HELO|nr:hypothetical protein BCON_0261g00190 [Botryotinia convoluta]